MHRCRNSPNPPSPVCAIVDKLFSEPVLNDRFALIVQVITDTVAELGGNPERPGRSAGRTAQACAVNLSRYDC